MRRRPVMINTATTSTPVNSTHKGRHRKGRPTYQTENVVTDGTEGEPESDDDSNSSGRSDDSAHQDLSISDSSSESSESSGYSDWVADHGVNLEPPKRSRRRQATKNKTVVNSVSNNQRDDQKSATEKLVRDINYFITILRVIVLL